MTVAINTATTMNTLELSNDCTESSTSTEDEFDEFLLVISKYEMLQEPTSRQPCRTSMTLVGYEYVQELIHGHPDRMFDSLRLEPHVFIRLCEVIRGPGFLQDSRGVCVEEAIFLLTMCHNIKTEWWRNDFNTKVRQLQTTSTVFLRLCVGTPAI